MKIEFIDYENIVNNLHEGIVIFNGNFDISFSNSFFCSLSEYDENEIKKIKVTDLIDKKQIDLFKNHISKNFDKSLEI